MKNLVYIVFFILIMNACKKQNRPIYSADIDSKSYNGSILARNDQYVFLNAKNAVIRMNHDGSNPMDLITFNPPIWLPELMVRDSVLVISNSANQLYIMGYNGLFKINSIQFNSQLSISDALVHKGKMLVLDGNSPRPDFSFTSLAKRGGYLELFEYDASAKTLIEIDGFYRGLYSDGFFPYNDSIIYSYDYTSKREFIEFSRFNINDSVPNVETSGFQIGNSKDVRISVHNNGDNVYVSDGKNIFICTLEQKFFVLKKKI